MDDKRLLTADGSNRLEAIKKIANKLAPGKSTVKEVDGEIVVQFKKGALIPLEWPTIKKLYQALDSDFYMTIGSINGQIILIFDAE